MTRHLVDLAVVQLLAVLAAVAAPGMQARSQTGAIWTVPEIGALPRDVHGLQIREGRDLITASYAYIGPNVPDESKRFASDNLACSNCHLQAGTKKFGLPYSASTAIFLNTVRVPETRSASRIASIRA